MPKNTGKKSNKKPKLTSTTISDTTNTYSEKRLFESEGEIEENSNKKPKYETEESMTASQSIIPPIATNLQDAKETEDEKTTKPNWEQSEPDWEQFEDIFDLDNLQEIPSQITFKEKQKNPSTQTSSFSFFPPQKTHSTQATTTIIETPIPVVLNEEVLINAIKLGDIVIVESYINSGKDIDFLYQGKIRPIELAAKHPHLHKQNKDKKNIFELLLDTLKQRLVAFDINRCDEKGRALIHFAAWSGLSKRVEFLIEQEKANLRAKNSEGLTLFHYAILSQDPTIIEYLKKSKYLQELTQEENLRIPRNKIHLLHFAAEKCQSYVIIGILKKIKNFEKLDTILDKNNKTPLHYAVLFNNRSAHSFADDENSYLIKSDQGITPLHILAGNGKLTEFKDVLRELKKKNVELNVKDNNSEGLIHYAAKSGQREVLDLLLTEFDFPPNEPNKDGNTPVLLAEDRFEKYFAVMTERWVEKTKTETSEQTEKNTGPSM